MASDKRLTRTYSLRADDEWWAEVERLAAEAGMNLSEYGRIKMVDDPKRGMRHDLHWAKEWAKSSVALSNIILLKLGMSIDDVQKMLPERKAALTRIEMGDMDEEQG